MAKFSEQLGEVLVAFGKWVAGRPAGVEGREGVKPAAEKKEDKTKTILEQTKRSFAQFDGKEQDPEVIEVLRKLLEGVAKENSDKFTEAEEKELEETVGMFYNIAKMKSNGKPVTFILGFISYNDKLKVKAEVLT